MAITFSAEGGGAGAPQPTLLSLLTSSWELWKSWKIKMNKQVVFLKIWAWPRCTLVLGSPWCRAGGSGEADGSRCSGLAVPWAEALPWSPVPVGLSPPALCWAQHPQPAVWGGSGHICWECPGTGVQLPSCWNDKINLAVLFLKLSQLKRQRQSVLFSLHWQNQDVVACTQLPIGQ